MPQQQSSLKTQIPRTMINTPISTSTPEQRNTLPSDPSTSIQTIRNSAKNRQISRYLGNIMDVDSLLTQTDRTYEYMLLVYRLGRAATTSQHFDIPCETESGLPGFSALCARLHPHNQASKTGYLSFIPASPTNPAVLKKKMTRLVKTPCLLGDQWTVITGEIRRILFSKHGSIALSTSMLSRHNINSWLVLC